MSTTAREERRLRREWLLTAVVAVVLLALLVFAQLARPWGNLIYDRMMVIQGFHDKDDIVIIAVDDRSLEQLGGWPLQRSRYTELLERLEDPQVQPKAVGLDLLFLDPTDQDAGLAKLMQRVPTVLPLEFSIGESDQISNRPRLSHSLPAPPLDQAARLSHTNVSFDSDGVIRGFQSVDGQYLHFALALHALGEPGNPQVRQAQLNPEYRRFRMVDPSIGFPMISLSDALSPTFPLSILKDKYVLLGVTAPSLGDRYPTLYSGEHGTGTPGVAILASILNASLNDEFITSPSAAWVFALNLIGVALLLGSFIYMKPRITFFLALGTMGVAFLISYGLLHWANWWVNPTPVMLAAALIQPFWAWRRLEAITGVIYRRANELRQLQPEARAQDSTNTHSREVVLQYAKLLDHAVDSARSELKFLSAVVDEMPDAVVIYDHEDNLLLSNNKMQNLMGDMPLGIGTPLSALAERWHLPMSHLSNLGTPEPSAVLPVRPSTNPSLSQQHVFQIETHTGRRDIYLKNASLDSPLGGQLHLLIFIDITELRQYQIQRDRALQFLSHDMRTPLASILSLTRTGPSSELVLHREKIDHHARALLSMMDDFILTVNAEAPRYDLSVELLDNLINDAIEQVGDLAHDKGVVLSDELSEEPIFVDANARLFIRALVNLLFNAVKFSTPGSRVVISSERHTNDKDQPRVRITISNPVNPEPTEQELPGFGLGLNFVDTVIERHQGRIERHIPPSGRAEVRIDLPTHTD